jgi:hypothetical protein
MRGYCFMLYFGLSYLTLERGNEMDAEEPTEKPAPKPRKPRKKPAPKTPSQAEKLQCFGYSLIDRLFWLMTGVVIGLILNILIQNESKKGVNEILERRAIPYENAEFRIK